MNIRKKIITRIISSDSWKNMEWSNYAKKLFAHQRGHNPVYRNWCRSQNTQALPIIAYKESVVVSFPVRKRDPWFESSGTTVTNVSRHYFKSLDLYRISVVEGWRWFLKKNGFVGPMNFIGIMPSFKEKPHSSLSCMVDILMKEFGDGNHLWAMKKNRWGWSQLARRLTGKKIPRVLFGTAFGWVHFLDWCKANNKKFHLSPETLAIETGGYKGRSRELTREDLHSAIAKTLGVRIQNICSEYSMCELSSQAYSFRKHGKLLFQFPPWCRIRVMRPQTSVPASKGERGVLEIHDLANVDSCAWIRTEDMAIAHQNGFELLGRLPKSGLKGCSLNFE